jgi:hypothetical protein
MNPPWLLLRGLSRETRHWGSFLPQDDAAWVIDEVRRRCSSEP